VSASWTFITAQSFPAVHRMAVAGRVRGRIDESPVSLRVELVGPDEIYRLLAEGTLEVDSQPRPYGDGMFGYIFAVDLAVPLPKPGLYEIFVTATSSTSCD
jgi:hypothetical protein